MLCVGVLNFEDFKNFESTFTSGVVVIVVSAGIVKDFKTVSFERASDMVAVAVIDADVNDEVTLVGTLSGEVKVQDVSIAILDGARD